MSLAAIACRHCGTYFSPQQTSEEFCCNGCRFVFDWINKEDLGKFYELKGKQITDAIGNSVFEPTDWEWVDRWLIAAEEESEGATSSAEVHLQGISCLACAWLIEKRFEEQSGSLRINLQTERGLAHLSWKTGAFDAKECFQDWARFGYRASESAIDDETESKSDPGFLTRMGVCGAFALNTMAFTLPSYFGLESDTELGALFRLIAFASATFAVLTGGGYFFRQAWQSLRSRILHIDLPIALGISVAYISSIFSWLLNQEELFYIDFVAIFVFLMLLGRWVQQRALAKCQRRIPGSIESLRISRKSADGSFEDAPANLIEQDDCLRLRPGTTLPVASYVEDDSVSVSLEWINGELEPITFQQGQEVPAGGRLVSQSPALFRAAGSFEEGLLGKLLDRRDGQDRDPLLERVLKFYLGVVLVLAVIGFSAWTALGSVSTALQVFVSILVVSCPCALGVAVPLLNSWTTRRLERFGIFVRNSSLWPRLLKVQQLAFDKTGTLTLPSPLLVNTEALEMLKPEELTLLSRLVENNRHPFARGLHEALFTNTSPHDKSGSNPVIEEPGKGVTLVDQDGHEWSLGKNGWKGSSPANCQLVFSREGQPVAFFQFEEAIRPDAIREIDSLSRQFSSFAILSGDKQPQVAKISREIGLNDAMVLGEQSPEQKANWLSNHGGEKTLFLGDGANDSLAFDAALCSGMPARDQSVLEGKADFCFLGQGLRVLRELFSAARHRQRILHQIFAFAITYNLAAVTLCLAGMMNPLLAAILMPLSSLATIALAASSNRGQDVRTINQP